MDQELTENEFLVDELICKNTQLLALNALKDRLLGDIIHNMRSPLATMVSMMELLEVDYDSDDNGELIHEVGEHVTKTFNKIESLFEGLNYQNKENTCLNLYETALEANKTVEDISILSYNEKSFTLCTHQEKLSRVLDNLYKLCFRLSKNKGLLSIQTHFFESKVIVSIIDTNINIEAEEAESLLKKTDYGIYIYHDFNNSGEIVGFNCNTGIDSTFYLYLQSKA